MSKRDPRELDHIRCHACGMPNDPRVRSHGGEFYPQDSEISGSTTERTEDDSGGCSFCHSPSWMSGGQITWRGRG